MGDGEAQKTKNRPELAVRGKTREGAPKKHRGKKRTSKKASPRARLAHKGVRLQGRGENKLRADLGER